MKLEEKVMSLELYPAVTKELSRARTALAPETAAAFQAFSQHAVVTLHVTNLAGVNSHHIAETCF